MAEAGGGAPVSGPEPLRANHDLSQFSNGQHAMLDAWLRERAAAGEGLSARTYVVCMRDPPNRVVGYYAISAASIVRAALPSAKVRRGMPDDVPSLLIGRLAVDAALQGRGLGGDLVVDATKRCVAAAAIVGARAIVAHAIDDAAARFYEKYGFVTSPLGERVMLLPMETARTFVGD